MKPADEWRSRRMAAFQKLWNKCTREMEDFHAHINSFEDALAAQARLGGFSEKLTSIAQVRTGASRADFWLQRRGTDLNVGRVTHSPQWSQYNIGITVKRPDIVAPEYLYYWFDMLWMRGHWHNRSYGTLPLQHIRATEVCQLVVTFRA